MKDFRDLKHATTYMEGPKIKKLSQDFAGKLLSDDLSMELWFFVDKILLDLAGRTLTWSEIIDHYQTKHSDIWTLMVSSLPQIMRNVLPKT
jgi:hypothetical protein